MTGRGTITKERVSAFTDGVIAIIITIMVLDIKMPEQGSFAALRPLLPVFLGYILSFVNVGIYWNNHHHMFAAAKHINGMVLLANSHLLFWLSLFPIMMAWLGKYPNSPAPAAAYGVLMLLASLAYWLLLKTVLSAQGPGSLLAKALGSDLKGKLSPALYAVAIPCAYIHPWIADALFVLTALIWLIPDQRIERTLAEQHDDQRAQKQDLGHSAEAPEHVDTLM